MRLLDAARTRLRLLLHRRADEARLDEEIRFHIDMETERLVRDEGLDPVAARRRAVRAFGVVEDHEDALHEGRGLAWLAGIAIDMRLGVRMLVKYPGLTIVGGIAMAFAIAAGAVVFELLTMSVNPRLPLPDGDRIVQVRLWDARESSAEPRALHDYAVWRQGLRTVTDLGAWRDVAQNLRANEEDTQPVNVAEITASAFRIAPARPLLGRMLTAADEQPGAPAIILLGHELWRTRFAGDSSVVGRAVQVGDAYPTVVGVMPEGFAFPIAHSAWMPFRLDAGAAQPRDGPGITVFGRLAPGATLEEAQAEIGAIGQRLSGALPLTHADLRPQVKPYPTVFYEAGNSDLQVFLVIELFVTLLFIVICSNIAMLMFARMATRQNELVVRTALGATRGRLVAQLFAEALVLGGAAAIVGLTVAAVVLGKWAATFMETNLEILPFWYVPGLSATTIVYAVALTMLGAAIAGALPALRITRSLGTQLRAASAGGAGVRFGGVWTLVIVVQVALTVAFPAVSWFIQHQVIRIRSQDVGFRPAEYLSARLDMEGLRGTDPEADTTAATRARHGAMLELLRTRVAAEPGVAGVTFVDWLPRDWHPDALVEIEGAPAGGTPDVEVSLAAIDPAYFDVLGAPVTGRAFHSGDLRPDSRVAIADAGFVREVLGGRSPIGMRVRFRHDPEDGPPPPWMEIVGVVKELGNGFAGDMGPPAGLYFPMEPQEMVPLRMIVRVRSEPLAFAPRLRTLAAGVNADLRLTEVQTLDDVASAMLWVMGVWVRITAAMTAITLLLSLAGIYAVLSFTVARRTREIGVRVALGATPRQVVAAVFRRPLTQVFVGALLGGALIATAALAQFGDGDVLGRGLSPGQAVLLVAYVLLMFGVCLLACVVPTRRALGVEPSVALRVE